MTGQKDHYKWQKNLEMKYPFHPAADLFPMMEYDEFMALADDIVDNGLLEPIKLFEGKIIDGRNRFKACLKMGVEPKFEEILGTEESLIPYVFAVNLQRRHLSGEQKIDLAVKLREQDWTQEGIAKVLRVSVGTINKWMKDKFKNENTKTRTDSKGRERPTSYKKEKVEETPEELLARRIEKAKSELETWLETYRDLGQKAVSDIVDVWLDGPYFKIKEEGEENES